MKQAKEILQDASLILMEIIYVVWGLFLSIFLSFLYYVSPRNIQIVEISFPIYIYALIVGVIYIVSGLLILRRRPFGLKLAVGANVLGIPFIVPIVLGMISFVLFNRPEIRNRFK